jgi:hypothetical protein
MSLASALQLFGEAAVIFAVGTLIIALFLWLTGITLLGYSIYRDSGRFRDVNIQAGGVDFWLTAPMIVGVVVIWGITTLRSLQNSISSE